MRRGMHLSFAATRREAPARSPAGRGETCPWQPLRPCATIHPAPPPGDPPMPDPLPTRRAALQAGAAAVTTLAAGPLFADAPKLKGNLNHSLCRWCYNKIPLEKLA